VVGKGGKGCCWVEGSKGGAGHEGWWGGVGKGYVSFTITSLIWGLGRAL
jgi:hypothetical protein